MPRKLPKDYKLRTTYPIKTEEDFMQFQRQYLDYLRNLSFTYQQKDEVIQVLQDRWTRAGILTNDGKFNRQYENVIIENNV